jgi:3-hydroxyisobutyrate dehydrogenase-like beta-hydroxyacid dehydrogenase
VPAAFAPSSNTFADVASATPKLKQALAERVSPSGASIGDASIMGGPPDGHRMAILASGPAAVQIRDLMVPRGMSVEPVGDAIGTASGIKIMRSILAKGLEALLVGFMLGTGRYGIDNVVLESFKFMAQFVRGHRGP